MRHTLGNTPKCNECYWYRDSEPNDGCRGDGWCTNKKQCSVGINGRKREHPPERESVLWNNSCRHWEDAEDRFTRFEADTRCPEEWRSEDEKKWLRELLKS
jgi:hypothetical protein